MQYFFRILNYPTNTMILIIGSIHVVDSVLTKSAASNFLTKQDYDLIVLDVKHHKAQDAVGTEVGGEDILSVR